MTKKITIIVLVSMMSSALQPAWSMEADAEKLNLGQKRSLQDKKIVRPFPSSEVFLV